MAYCLHQRSLCCFYTIEYSRRLERGGPYNPDKLSTHLRLQYPARERAQAFLTRPPNFFHFLLTWVSQRLYTSKDSTYRISRLHLYSRLTKLRSLNGRLHP